MGYAAAAGIARNPRLAAATLEEERREVLESVTRALRQPHVDPERSDACSYLLRHLARTASI